MILLGYSDSWNQAGMANKKSQRLNFTCAGFLTAGDPGAIRTLF
jgi:hypothetical protein